MLCVCAHLPRRLGTAPHCRGSASQRVFFAHYPNRGAHAAPPRRPSHVRSIRTSPVLAQSALLDAVPPPPVASPHRGPATSAAGPITTGGGPAEPVPPTTSSGQDAEDSSDTFASGASGASPNGPTPSSGPDGAQIASGSAAPAKGHAEADAPAAEPAATAAGSRQVVVTLPPHVNPPQVAGDAPVLFALSGPASSPSLVRVEGAQARILLSMASGDADAKQPAAHQTHQARHLQQHHQQHQHQQRMQLPYGPPPGSDKDGSAYMHHYMAQMQHAAAMQGYPGMAPQHHMAAMAGMMPHPMQMHAQQPGQGMYPWAMMRDRMPYGYPSHPGAAPHAVMAGAGPGGKLHSSMPLGGADAGGEVPLHRPRAAPAQSGAGHRAAGRGDAHLQEDPAFLQPEEPGAAGARSAKQRAAPSKRRRGGRQSAHNRQCALCATRVTPKWRRGPDGSILCNACGLHKNKMRERKQFLYMKELAARATSGAGPHAADLMQDSTHNRRIAVRRAANAGDAASGAMPYAAVQQAPGHPGDAPPTSVPASLQASLAAAASALARADANADLNVNANANAADAGGVELEEDGPTAESDATVPRRKRSRRGRMPRLRVENDYEYDVDGAAASEAPPSSEAAAEEPAPFSSAATAADHQKAAKGRTLSILADAAAAAAADKKETSTA